MNIHETLKGAMTEAAAAVAVPLFWEGEVFTPPMAPHTVAQVVIEHTKASTLGKNGLTRTDGALFVKCRTVSGQGETEAVALSRLVSKQFPRGKLFEVDGDELTLGTPLAGTATTDGLRLTVPLKIPFYALTQEG